MSKSHVPTLPLVIPLYFRLEQHLEKHDNSEAEAFSSAASTGLTKLHKYTQLAYSSEITLVGNRKWYIPIKVLYLILSVLHPGMRLSFLQKAFSESKVARSRIPIRPI